MSTKKPSYAAPKAFQYQQFDFKSVKFTNIPLWDERRKRGLKFVGETKDSDDSSDDSSDDESGDDDSKDESTPAATDSSSSDAKDEVKPEKSNEEQKSETLDEPAEVTAGMSHHFKVDSFRNTNVK